MKLEHPLSGLVNRCQTICVPECCGTDAYDFSPIHIASFLIMWQGQVNHTDLEALKSQLQTLRASYGIGGTSSEGVTIEEMNQIFSGEDIEHLIRKIEWNLEVALRLITTSGKEQYKEERGS